MSERTVEICPLWHTCGACTCINVPYGEQLAKKQAYVAELFDEIAGENCVCNAILGMDDPFRFRDKIVSPFAYGKRTSQASRRDVKGKGSRDERGSRGKDKGKGGRDKRETRPILCGMYAAHSHRIVAVPTCPVEHESGRRIIAAVASLMRKWDIKPYNEDAGTGFLRHVVVRVGHNSGEVLVTLVTNGEEFPGSRNFARELVKRCPEITTIVQNVNTRQTNAILGRDERTLFGPGFILDTLCGLSFRISAHSFYQVNASQTEVLYRCAIQMAGLDESLGAAAGDAAVAGVGTAEGAAGAGAADAVVGNTARPLTVIDAYCGTGTIGLVAAATSENVHVIGVDSVESAIVDARQNARHNGIENAEFVVGDAGEFMRQRAAAIAQVRADAAADAATSADAVSAATDADTATAAADVLFLDPPRAGASVEFIDAAALMAPARIVYISCNPETQVRDVRQLISKGYRLDRIQPVDMFPHTDHVECVVLLSKPGK